MKELVEPEQHSQIQPAAVHPAAKPGPDGDDDTTDDASAPAPAKKAQAVLARVRPYDPHADDLSVIRSLFAAGMRDVGAPEDYIRRSLGLDLASVDRLRDTYFAGRGTYLVLVEEDRNGGESGDDGRGGERRAEERIVGMVALQDISFTTGKKVANTARRQSKHVSRHCDDDDEDQSTTARTTNLCELRRMSIDSSRRRSGYGAKLVEACVSHARAGGFDGIKVSTGGWMGAAIALYVKMGFEEVGRTATEHKMDDGTIATVAKLEMMF